MLIPTYLSTKSPPRGRGKGKDGHVQDPWKICLVRRDDHRHQSCFYRSVIGWDAKDSGMTDRSYTLFSMGPTMVGGLMPIPEDARKAGVRPAWMGYIAVDDVD